MDYPGNNDGFSPPQNPSAKKKRKTNNSAAARRAAAAERSRFGLAASSSSSMPESFLPPDPTNTLVARNPFDDSPASTSGPSRAPPPGYPAGMDFTMMRLPGMQQQQQQMNVNYAPMSSDVNAMIPRMPQNFGHSVGPKFNAPMIARAPGPLRPRLPRGEPPPYPNVPVSGPISTLSRMHMSMGNVNVAKPAAAAVGMAVNDPNVNLNLAGMPAVRAMMPPPTSSDSNKRKAASAAPFYVGQAPVQPYQPFQFNVAGQIHHRPPMCQLPPSLLGKLPYSSQPQPPISLPGSSILQSQLTRPAERPADDPPAAPTFSSAGINYPVLGLNQKYQVAEPTPCGGCELDVYPGEDAVMCCAGCDFWFHRECSGLTVMAHHMLLLTAFTDWACDFCFSTKEVPLIKFT